MSNILCVYYSRTGHTEKIINEVATALGCEAVALEDGVDRSGFIGWIKSGMQAMAREIPEVSMPKTEKPLSAYDLVILGTPVWAGRCSAPMRSFLMQYGKELPTAAHLITRGGKTRYEEVFDQMDFYLKNPRAASVSICPDAAGSSFWKEEFIRKLQETCKGGTEHAG